MTSMSDGQAVFALGSPVDLLEAFVWFQKEDNSSQI